MSEVNALAQRIDALLPQTQCTKCGYAGCRPYADAIASGQASYNQCPPGGAEGVARLAKLLGRPVIPLNPENGVERPRPRAVIDESLCIGCTLCLQACPVDAIVGAAKLMHTVIEDRCTGCDLCVPPCPVDCIEMVPVTGERTGWDAWSATQADEARVHFEGGIRPVSRRTRPSAKPVWPPANRPSFRLRWNVPGRRRPLSPNRVWGRRTPRTCPPKCRHRSTKPKRAASA